MCSRIKKLNSSTAVGQFTDVNQIRCCVSLSIGTVKTQIRMYVNCRVNVAVATAHVRKTRRETILKFDQVLPGPVFLYRGETWAEMRERERLNTRSEDMYEMDKLKLKDVSQKLGTIFFTVKIV